MSDGIVVGSSSLAGNVLTFTMKVDPTGAALNNFGLTFTFDAAKVTNVSATGIDGNFTPNTEVAGQLIMAWASNTAAQPGQTLATIAITLADPATSFLTTYSGDFGVNSTLIPDTPLEVGDGFFNFPVQGGVTLGGSPVEDQVLVANATALTDGDGLGPFTYHWLREGVEVSSGSASQYTLGDADVGQHISVRVSYTDLAGHTESKDSAATALVTNVNDAPTGSVTITGRAADGATLTAVSTLADADGMGTLSYTWSAGGVAVASSASNTYKLTANEVGKTVTVTASYTDGHSTPESISSTATDVVVANQRPTGFLTIDKPVPSQGDTLTVTNNLDDPDGNGPISYQWFAGTAAIGTGDHVTLTQAEVGKDITVVASYIDGLGVDETVSLFTSPVANVNDAPLGAVTISGTPAEGSTLSVTNNLTDLDGVGAISYQWFADGAAISGATNPSLTLTQAEVRKTITVAASYTDGFGHAESVVSVGTPTVGNLNDAPQGSVTITGTPEQGQALTASNDLSDEDGLGAISYQWFADGTPIAGANTDTYTLTQAEVTRTIMVQASYTDGFSFPEQVASASTAAVANVNDAPTGTLAISNATPSKGQTLTFSNTVQDADGLGTFAFQWFKDGVAIGSATGSSYQLTTDDVGGHITVQGTYTDGFGHAETITSAATAAVLPNSPPTGTVTLNGTVQQGTALTASQTLADADGLGAITFHWMSGTTELATGSTFTPTQADVNKPLTVEARYTDNNGTPEVVASAAQTVANVDDPLTGTLTIDKGTPVQGDTLTAQNTFADADGLDAGSIVYQWLANGAAISGATGSTLQVGQAQVGSAIAVRATHTDLLGGTESRTSAATAVVANVNDAPGGLPAISNTVPSQGQTLTVNTGAITDLDGLGAFSFLWMAGGVAITGATSTTLALTQAHVGKDISVQVSYTDGFGHAETVTSVPTSPVANVNDTPTGTVTIDGVHVVGLPLQAGTATIADIDGLGTFSFQWLQGTTAIAGATAATYTPVAADAGQNIAVQVSWTDLGGTHESLTSTAVAVVDEDAVTPLVAPGVTQLTGDGNGDGLVDSTQPAVASVPLTDTGNAQVFATLVVDSSSTGGVNTGSSAVIQSLDQEPAPAGIPGQMTAPLGLIDFTAATTAGQTETFTLFVDRGTLHVNGYWKQDEHGTWVNLASQPFGGSMSNVGNKVRLDFSITDGGEFDADHAANGVIVDPAIIGEMPLSLVGYTPDVTLTPTTHFFF